MASDVYDQAEVEALARRATEAIEGGRQTGPEVIPCFGTFDLVSARVGLDMAMLGQALSQGSAAKER